MQSQFIKVAFLLLSIAVISVRSGNKGSYLKHKKMLEKFCCGKPQPRVMELEEILDKNTLEDITSKGLKSAEVKPSVTVLQRCNSTGFCENSKHRCAPVDAEKITLTFSYEDADNKMQYRDVQLENHTKCDCKPIDDSIK